MVAVQFKRRNSGAAGAPTTLKSGEPAYNAVDKKLYIGSGDDGTGNAASIEVVADVAKLANAATSADITAALAAQTITESQLDAALQSKINGSLQNKFDATSDPGATDDSAAGYAVGSTWINTATDKAWRCVDATAGAAVWINTTLTTTDLGSMATQQESAVNITGGVISGSVVIDGGTF